MDYQVLKDLSIPLRDAVNYAATTYDSDAYAKLIFAQNQISASLKGLRNIVRNTIYGYIIIVMYHVLHF